MRPHTERYIVSAEVVGASRVRALETEVNVIISCGRLARCGFGIWSGPPTGGWADAALTEDVTPEEMPLMNDENDTIMEGPRPLHIVTLIFHTLIDTY